MVSKPAWMPNGHGAAKSRATPKWQEGGAAEDFSQRSEVKPEMCFICDCDHGLTWATPLLCVHLDQKDSKLSRNSTQILNDCLARVPGAPARKDLKPESNWLGRTFLNLFPVAKSKGMHSFLQQGVGVTVEGAVDSIQMRAVGVGKNKAVTERAFYLAMTLAIMLQLRPSECDAICSAWGMHSLVQQARELLQQFATEAPKTLCLDSSGHRFIVASDQCNFVFGACTTPKSYTDYTAIKEDIHIYLLSQTCLVIDFHCFDVMGNAGEIVFAVIKPTHLLDWGPTWLWRAEEREPSNCPGLILDMQCRANVKLVKLLLANRNVLKVCWSFEDHLEDLLRHLNEGGPAEILQNVLALQKVFCPSEKMSLSEYWDGLGLTAGTWQSHEHFAKVLPWPYQRQFARPFAKSFLEHAAHNVLVLEELISHGTPECSYSKAWTTSWHMIEAWEHLRGPPVPNTAGLQVQAEIHRQEGTSPSPMQVLPTSLDVLGQRFLLVSDRFCFMQGGCTPTSGRELESIREQLMSRWSSVLIDFQGEMMGRAGEIYFAVVKPTDSKHFLWREFSGAASVDTTTSKTDEESAQTLPLPEDQKSPVGENPAFILDMATQVNVELVKDLLANPSLCKVCWDCKEALEGLMYQTHPVEIKADIQNLVDAQIAFSPDEGNLSLSEAMQRLKQAQESSFEDESVTSASASANVGKDWDRLELLQSPDWDRFHAHNQRAVRRPFSQIFLEHSAAKVLAMEALVACPTTWSSAWDLTRSLIRAVRSDTDGLKSLEQLKAQLQHSNQAATAMKYYRHFATVHSVTEAWEELRKEQHEYKEVRQELETWIISELPVPRVPFQGDQVHDLICKVLRNMSLTKEDFLGFKTMVASFFPHGVSICRFEQVQHLETWKAQLEENAGYLLKQDEETFFLQRGFFDPMTNQTLAGFFGHLSFRTGTRRSARNPGAWWGLPRNRWSEPDAETRKRAMQAIAWIFFSQTDSIEQSWHHFNITYAIVEGGIPQLRKARNFRLKRFWICGAKLCFTRHNPDIVYCQEARAACSSGTKLKTGKAGI